jgi:hypothetical protein
MKADQNEKSIRPPKASNAGSTRVDLLTFEELQPGEINHYKSHHVRQLQISKYVSMEHNAHHALQITAEERKDERLLAKKELAYIREVDV